MVRLLEQPGVDVVKSDQCMYGLYTNSPDGSYKLARKPTQWASSSPQMPARLSQRCDGLHEHQALEGGRASHAALYPPKLITQILKGIRDTADAVNTQSQQEENHPAVVASTCQNSGFCLPYPVQKKEPLCVDGIRSLLASPSPRPGPDVCNQQQAIHVSICEWQTGSNSLVFPRQLC